MSDSAEGYARKALNRLRHAAEKALREMDELEGALARAEADDFPRATYDAMRTRLVELIGFTEEEGARLQEKILRAGGLEPGRVKRGSG
jgi:hypothetical protein